MCTCPWRLCRGGVTNATKESTGNKTLTLMEDYINQTYLYTNISVYKCQCSFAVSLMVSDCKHAICLNLKKAILITRVIITWCYITRSRKLLHFPPCTFCLGFCSSISACPFAKISSLFTKPLDYPKGRGVYQDPKTPPWICPCIIPNKLKYKISNIL